MCLRTLARSLSHWLDSNGAAAFLRAPGAREAILGSSVCESFLIDLKSQLRAADELELSLSDPGLADLSALIAEELADTKSGIETKSDQIRQLVLLAMEADNRFEEDSLGARLEIRAGVGGVEAANWAAEIFSMYQAAADRMGWSWTSLSSADTVLQAEVSGSDELYGPYGWLKFEAGVHRVQRIPFNSDRMQTSAAGVWVMPKVEVPQITLRDSDLKISISKKSSGAGGQSVNAAYQQVRMVHVPSGFAVTVSDSQAQQENREIAYTKVLTHLQRMAEEKVVGQLTRNRKSQIKTADRSEKIRTYNFERNEVNDHRVPGVVELFLHTGDLMSLWGPLKLGNENLRINEFICQKGRTAH